MNFKFLSILALLSGLLLSGCATPCTPVTVQVKVPVPVPCAIKVPKVPTFPLQALPTDEADPFVIMQNALAEIELRKGYELKLNAAISACNTTTPIPTSTQGTTQ